MLTCVQRNLFYTDLGNKWREILPSKSCWTFLLNKSFGIKIHQKIHQLFLRCKLGIFKWHSYEYMYLCHIKETWHSCYLFYTQDRTSAPTTDPLTYKMPMYLWYQNNMNKLNFQSMWFKVFKTVFFLSNFGTSNLIWTISEPINC